MTDKLLQEVLSEEYKDLNAPPYLKTRVLKSIDWMTVVHSLAELFDNVPTIVLDGQVRKSDKSGRNKE